MTDPEIDLIERMGFMAQADGIPRIAGRLWGLFVIVGDVLSFSEIAETLKISRGSVSTNARILENLDILERRTVPGERQDYFAMRQEPYFSLLKSSVKRQREKMDIVRGAQAAIDRPEAKHQLHELALFYEALVGGFETSIKDLEATSKKKSAAKNRPRKRMGG
ncbi:hypothetical protein [Pyruvatibacter sp.]|uniref:GbsR/MarR family transcriptional regulator n=1 Tax=Pyruvatibacter sp. TaxID=1981328 RepID=UPI0032ED6B8A